MKLPQFNAESSLGPTKGIYRGNAVLGGSGGIVPMLKKQRSCTTKYAGYVDYPMTVCSGWGDLVTGLDWNTIAASPSVPDWAPAWRSVTHLNLSAAPSAASRASRFCRVSGGPWFAQVTTIGSCYDWVPDVSTLEITGAPEHFAIQWTGDLQDIPAPFSAQLFSLAGPPSCSCCGGFTQCPDGRCVPHGTSCDIYPA
jgi:hypothetical protein